MSRADAEVALAFVSRLHGAREMAAGRWAHILSLELGWLSPGDARRFIDGAAAAAILVPTGEGLRLAVDPQAVVVPRRFRLRPDMILDGAPSAPPAPAPATPTPAKDSVDDPEPQPAAEPKADVKAEADPDPFLGLVARIAATTEWDRSKVLAEVTEVQTRMGGLIAADAAAMLLAAAHGIDVRQDARQALNALRTG